MDNKEKNELIEFARKYDRSRILYSDTQGNYIRQCFSEDKSMYYKAVKFYMGEMVYEEFYLLELAMRFIQE